MKTIYTVASGNMMSGGPSARPSVSRPLSLQVHGSIGVEFEIRSINTTSGTLALKVDHVSADSFEEIRMRCSRGRSRDS